MLGRATRKSNPIQNIFDAGCNYYAPFFISVVISACAERMGRIYVDKAENVGFVEIIF